MVMPKGSIPAKTPNKFETGVKKYWAYIFEARWIKLLK